MASRRSLAVALARYRPLHWIAEPGTLEGGDVVRIGATLYVGRSARSNDAGIAQLAQALAPLGYTVRAVEMQNCLHLKSGCTYLGRGTILANREWVDAGQFENCRVIDVAHAEPAAADVLAIGDTAIVPASFPETACDPGARRLAGAAYRCVGVAEGGGRGHLHEFDPRRADGFNPARDGGSGRKSNHRLSQLPQRAAALTHNAVQIGEGKWGRPLACGGLPARLRSGGAAAAPKWCAE